MCEPGQLTMFYKMNRSWGLLFPSAGKQIYSECIVPHGYNAAGNGGRDTHSERMPVMAKKHAAGHKGNLSDRSFQNKTKPPISSGNPKSDLSDMEVFTEYKRF